MKTMKRLFTLIELVIVIVVLGILAAIVIPNISNVKDKTIEVAVDSDKRNIQTEVDMIKLEESELPTIGEGKAELGDPKLIDFEKLVPHYLNSVPEQGYFGLDQDNIVYGSLTNTPYNLKTSEGKLTW